MIQKINLNNIIQIKNKTLKNKKNDEKTWDNDLTENKSLEITESKKKQSKKKARTIPFKIRYELLFYNII